MIGLSVELTYPSQTMKWTTLRSVPATQRGQNGNMMYMRKNGSQQSTKAPIMMAIVRAARRSFDSDMRCFSATNRDI